jgi:hypothetical protein
MLEWNFLGQDELDQAVKASAAGDGSSSALRRHLCENAQGLELEGYCYGYSSI